MQPKRSIPEEAVGPNEPPAKKGRAKGQNSSTKRLINVAKTVTERGVVGVTSSDSGF